MKVYIYELGLMKTGYVIELTEDVLQDYALVGKYDLLTINNDLTQSVTVLPAYVKKA